jgi:S-sulfo-L-cysteine synthase (O-acetyl-L-serine-dependent)
MGRSGKKLALVPRALGQSALQRIGNTPLLRFERLMRDLAGVAVLAKAEWVNPGGSVKDRPAANIVAEAVAAGKLGRGRTLLDSTSGNTGIAYAMLGAAHGFRVTLCMPHNVSEERKRTICAYGAEIVFTEATEGSDGAIRKARELAAAEPRKYFYADQYSN